MATKGKQCLANCRRSCQRSAGAVAATISNLVETETVKLNVVIPRLYLSADGQEKHHNVARIAKTSTAITD